MISKETIDKIATLAADIATVKYCDDIPRGYRVMAIFGELSRILLDKFQGSSDSLEAADVLGQVLRNLNDEVKKETGRRLY